MVPVDQSLVDNGDGDAVGGVAVKTEQTTDGESLMDRVERRRRQNRINQRAFREFYSSALSIWVHERICN